MYMYHYNIILFISTYNQIKQEKKKLLHCFLERYDAALFSAS